MARRRGVEGQPAADRFTDALKTILSVSPERCGRDPRFDCGPRRGRRRGLVLLQLPPCSLPLDPLGSLRTDDLAAAAVVVVVVRVPTPFVF